MAYIGDVRRQSVLRNVKQGDSADGELSLKSPYPTHENGSEGGFAASALADQGRKTTRRDGKIHSIQNFPSWLIAKPQAFAKDGGIAGEGAVSS